MGFVYKNTKEVCNILCALSMYLQGDDHYWGGSVITVPQRGNPECNAWKTRAHLPVCCVDDTTELFINLQ